MGRDPTCDLPVSHSFNDRNELIIKEQAFAPAPSKTYPQNALARLYRKLWMHYNGDRGKLMLFTIVMLLLSETPIWFFTALDVLKLKSVFKYRLHYAAHLTEHLGIRKYPPTRLLMKAAKIAEFNFFFAYVIPGTLLIKLANKLGIFVYDTDHQGITWRRIIKEVFCISVLCDTSFYWMHRTLHRPSLYKSWHKLHHDFKFSVAIAHHYMSFKEAMLFALPQALPPFAVSAMSMLLSGRKAHLISMWIAFYLTQINVIIGHAGYQVPFLPRWFPTFQPAYHDYHHVDYKANFGALYPLTDWVFGSYVKAAVAGLAPEDGSGHCRGYPEL